MKYFFYFFMFSFAGAQAQNSLSGIVYLYNENGPNKPLANVYIKAINGGTYITKENGFYTLSFSNETNIARLSIRKDGYEIINDDELSNLDLSKKKLLNIYMDREGNILRRTRELQDISFLTLKRRKDRYLDILSKGGIPAENLKAELEKQSGQIFSSDDDLRYWIFDKFGADNKTIEDIIPIIIRKDLDHSNKDFQRIKNYLEKGFADSAVNVLHLSEDFKNAKNNLAEIDLRIKTNKSIRDKYWQRYRHILLKVFTRKWTRHTSLLLF